MQEVITIINKSFTLFKKRSRLYVDDLQNISDGFLLLESDFLNINALVKENVIIDGKSYLLYDSNTKCSRGFKFTTSDKQDRYHFIIEYPATISDIAAMFNYIESFMIFIDSDEFYFDEEVYNKDDITKVYNHCISFNRITIKELLQQDNIIIGGIFFPFEVENNFIVKLRGKDDEEIFHEFDEYIFEKQNIDYFFMRPRITYKTEDDKLIIIFAIGYDYQFLIYKNKNDYLLLSEYSATDVTEWLVVVPNNDNSEITIEYDEFIDSIPQNNRIQIDDRIMLVSNLEFQHNKKEI